MNTVKVMINSRTNIVLVLFIVLPFVSGAGDGKRAYKKGAEAFYAGNHENAARLLVTAARTDPACRETILNAENMLPQECGERPGHSIYGDPASEVLYRLALLEKEMAENEVEIRSAGNHYLDLIISHHKGSPWEDDAAFLLMQGELCLVNVGYPACIELSIRKREEWLNTYLSSERADEVLIGLAESYIELGEEYEREAPWHSDIKAEICRGRAVEIAELLITGHGARTAQWAKDFIADIRKSGTSFSTVPSAALD